MPQVPFRFVIFWGTFLKSKIRFLVSRFALSSLFGLPRVRLPVTWGDVWRSHRLKPERLHAVHRFGLFLSRLIPEVHSCSCYARMLLFVVPHLSRYFHFCSAFVLIRIFWIQNLILVAKLINTIRNLILVANSINSITR